jgi:hypothetical protein
MKQKIFDEWEFKDIKPLVREKTETLDGKDFGFIILLYITTISILVNIGAVIVMH